MNHLDGFKLTLKRTATCTYCHRKLEIETEPFDANLINCAAEISDQDDMALAAEGWVDGYCGTCVARGFGKDN